MRPTDSSLTPKPKPERADVDQLRKHAVEILNAGIQAVDSATAVRRCLRLTGDALSVGERGEFSVPLRYDSRVWVIGAGKATAGMARAAEDILGKKITGGAVVIPHGHPAHLSRIPVLRAGHPIPDAAGISAAKQIAAIAASAREEDLLLVLISGGGSALLPSPADGVTLEGKQEVTSLLLRSGASIHEVNIVRKHLSGLKGGQLARLAVPAQVVTLMVSDVIGDDPATIASGPTAPDPSTFRDALGILVKYNLTHQVPEVARAFLKDGLAGRRAETPKPGDPIFDRVRNVVIASNAFALAAMARTAAAMGYETEVLSEQVAGEARIAGERHVRRSKDLRSRHARGSLCILSGGETTVTVKGEGKGGRNQEFCLAAAMAMDGWQDMLLLSAGTDGIDGTTGAAGALADGTSIARAKGRGLSPVTFLEQNDSNTFFSALNDLVVTGATGTNVMDVQVVLCV